MRTCFLLLALLAVPALSAQSPVTFPTRNHTPIRAWTSNVVMPQVRNFHLDPTAAAVRVERVSVHALVVDGVATTTLDVRVENVSDVDATAELLLPVPDGAVVSGFEFQGQSTDATAVVLSRDEARATFDSIVARMKDPALLEFAAAAVIRSSVFPVSRRGTQQVRVRYEQVLPVEGARWDYVLPRSESLSSAVPWDVEVEVRSARPIADVYSPSHDLQRVETGARRVTLRARPNTRMEPGPLQVSVLLGEGPLATTLFTSADADGPGGWFLLLAGLGETNAKVASANGKTANTTVPVREVTLVLDRSGSMAGEKFDQARAAAKQVVEGLAFGEFIQIIDYSDKVERFAAEPVAKSHETLPLLRAYLDGLSTNGGTNLDGALNAALSAPVNAGRFPVVLFMTDGLPTVGEKREHVIRSNVDGANTGARRIFTFGVGNDVNASLLDAVAVQSRGRATYVRPDDDIELAVAGVFKNLAGPTVTDLSLVVRNEQDALDTRLVRDLYPRVLPDLYSGDRLVLVGRYTAREQVHFELNGVNKGQPTSWTLGYDFARALPRNDFVRRLWAMRRIAGLEDDLRLAGADPSALVALKTDPRFAEIAQEMLELATRFGVLTNSTAFLALEGTVIGDKDALVAEACRKALDTADARSGLGSVVSQQNIDLNRSQSWVNASNCQYSPEGVVQATATVQTIQGRTFFRRGSSWVDGACVLDDEATRPEVVVEFGSAEYRALSERLHARGQVGILSLEGEVLLRDGERRVRVKPPVSPKPATASIAADEGC